MRLSYTITAAALMSSLTHASEPISAKYDKGYFVFGTNSESFALKFDGRIMYDTGFVSSDKNDFVENNEIRRARFGIKTKFSNKWAGEFDLDFTGNEAKIKDLWMSYIGLENFEFKVGNHKPFFSVAEMTTSRWATFMETSMITDASASGRRLGLSGSYQKNDVFFGLSVFGDGIGVNNRDPEGDESEPGVHEKYNYSFRALYRPFVNKDASKLFHIGVNYLHLKPESDDNSKLRLRVGLESNVFDYEPLNTGKIKNISEQASKGIELVGRYKKYMVQAEYMTNTLNSLESASSSIDSDGFYIETSYMIFGSGRNYNLFDGEFGPVYPEHHSGNLELALRYSTIDLNDGDVLGGSADNITIALNWYAHTNIVIRLNHTVANLDENADGNGDYTGSDDISITGLRFQYMF